VCADKARSAVEGQLRKVLAERVHSYHTQGLDGIADFDRGKSGKSSIAEDLRNSTIASKGFQKLMPNAFRALTAYPMRSGLGGESFYFWTRTNVLGRKVFMLNQRLAVNTDAGSIVVERQFYSTQFFAAGQTLTGYLPVQEGNLVFYVNHSFVDRWTGLAAKAKRHIGLKIINKTLTQMAEDYGLCE
jgi:hypothetical protein